MAKHDLDDIKNRTQSIKSILSKIITQVDEIEKEFADADISTPRRFRDSLVYGAHLTNALVHGGTVDEIGSSIEELKDVTMQLSAVLNNIVSPKPVGVALSTYEFNYGWI